MLALRIFGAMAAVLALVALFTWWVARKIDKGGPGWR
jgi:flagellar biogenesis protein FliO